MNISVNLKPKVYKKNLYIGKKRVYRFTKDYTFKFMHKALWYFIIGAMLFTMIFGGLALILAPRTTTTNFSPITIPNSK